MQLTSKIRVYPTAEQKGVLWTLSEQCRLIYNFALSDRKMEYETTGKTIPYVEQQNQLPEIKEMFPKYKQVNSKVLQMVLRTLEANYRSFFMLIKQDPLAKPPGYRGKDYFFTMKYNQSGFEIKDNLISLSHKVVDGEKLQFVIPSGMTFTNVKQIDIFQDTGKWYLSVVDEIIPPRYTNNDLYQAFDLGITKQTAVNTDGKFFEVKNIRPDRYWAKPITELQGRRDHCKKRDKRKKNCQVSSKRWVQLNNLKRKCERKCSNQIKDFQHKVSKMIVENTKANTIIIGDLDVKSMPKSKKMVMNKKAKRSLNRSTQGTGYLGRFAEFLTYKAERIGKKVIEISERGTSKQCCKCGKIHPEMTLENRIMECDCGNRIDRDQNSSVNIMVRFLSQNALWTGYQQFVGNLRKTGLNIISVHSQEAPCVSVG